MTGVTQTTIQRIRNGYVQEANKDLWHERYVDSSMHSGVAGMRRAEIKAWRMLCPLGKQGNSNALVRKRIIDLNT